MALTLRGSGQVSADNYGIDSDGSITATGITSTGITSTGNVGIGTTSPETRLDVRSATATYLTVGNTTDNTSGLDTGIIFKQIGNIGNPATIQVIGNLSPTSGSAYTAGFKFKTGDWNGSVFSSVDSMTIAASGHVTTPNQPSFLAHSPAGLGSSTSIMKNFVTVVHNTGGHLNSTSGYFTAPVAGKYFITAGILVGTGTGRLEFHLEKNSGSPYISGNGTGTTYDGPTISAVFDLSVNDTMRVRLGSGSPHSGGNHPNTYFCGYLLG
jgi:hypothetical protein